MRIITDSREQARLIFPQVEGVEYETHALPVGDYGAYLTGEIIMYPTVFERKGSDLFSSFSHGYAKEKKKIEKAKNLGLKYILAVEGTAFDIREGHRYQKDGEEHWSKKDGLSQVRQLLTCNIKGYFDIWWCKSRQEMAFLIQEYFLACQRLKNEAS